MSTVLIGILIAVVLMAAVAFVAMQELRRSRLRRQFGPEFDRLARDLGSNRKAETELLGLQRKAARLSIRPLSPERQAQYATDWAGVQERFVDSPVETVSAARRLIARAMRDRGYPDTTGRDLIVNLSVHHPRALQDFRKAEVISGRAAEASTEELREAVLGYRMLFSDLTGGAQRRDIRQLTGSVTRLVPVITSARPRQEASK